MADKPDYNQMNEQYRVFYKAIYDAIKDHKNLNVSTFEGNEVPTLSALDKLYKSRNRLDKGSNQPLKDFFKSDRYNKELVNKVIKQGSVYKRDTDKVNQLIINLISVLKVTSKTGKTKVGSVLSNNSGGAVLEKAFLNFVDKQAKEYKKQQDELIKQWKALANDQNSTLKKQLADIKAEEARAEKSLERAKIREEKALERAKIREERKQERREIREERREERDQLKESNNFDDIKNKIYGTVGKHTSDIITGYMTTQMQGALLQGANSGIVDKNIAKLGITFSPMVSEIITIVLSAAIQGAFQGLGQKIFNSIFSRGASNAVSTTSARSLRTATGSITGNIANTAVATRGASNVVPITSARSLRTATMAENIANTAREGSFIGRALGVGRTALGVGKGFLSKVALPLGAYDTISRFKNKDYVGGTISGLATATGAGAMLVPVPQVKLVLGSLSLILGGINLIIDNFDWIKSTFGKFIEWIKKSILDPKNLGKAFDNLSLFSPIGTMINVFRGVNGLFGNPLGDVADSVSNGVGNLLGTGNAKKGKLAQYVASRTPALEVLTYPSMLQNDLPLVSKGSNSTLLNIGKSFLSKTGGKNLPTITGALGVVKGIHSGKGGGHYDGYKVDFGFNNFKDNREKALFAISALENGALSLGVTSGYRKQLLADMKKYSNGKDYSNRIGGYETRNDHFDVVLKKAERDLNTRNQVQQAIQSYKAEEKQKAVPKNPSVPSNKEENSEKIETMGQEAYLPDGAGVFIQYLNLGLSLDQC